MYIIKNLTLKRNLKGFKVSILASETVIRSTSEILPNEFLIAYLLTLSALTNFFFSSWF